MFEFIIMAMAVFSTFVVYDYSSAVIPTVPSIPSIFGGTHSSILFGSSGAGLSSSLSSNPLPNILTFSKSPVTTSTSPQPGTSIQNPYSTQTNALPENAQQLPPINPGFATFALCGNDQVVTSYDKTNMMTGGNIVYVTVNAPSITATLVYPNGTNISTLSNQVAGCVTMNKLPPNTTVSVLLTGDFTGTFQTSTTTGYVLISCYPDWKQSIAYDQYGNVIQKFNPAIDHPSYCNLNYR